MTQKTRSLLLLGGLVVLLGVIVLVWRSLSDAAASEGAVYQASTSTLVTREEASLQEVTSSSIAIVSPIATTTVSISDEVSLLVAGDIMLDRTVATRTKSSGDTLYPFRKLPENWISSFDFALANLEGPLTAIRRPPEKSIDFQFDPVWAERLKGLGWDGFSQANNHALDQGSAGSTDSVTRLRAAGFVTFGHQVNDGLIALATTTVKGERIAFLGWNNTDNPVNLEQAQQAITLAKSEATLTIAYLHWGNEYRSRPDAQNVELAHWLIDQGVDVVIGGHPHWVQGFSSYMGKPIIWSLGNFVFDQDWSKETQQGLAVEFRITPETLRILPVPLSIKLSQPKKEEGAVLAARLQALAKISDVSLQQVIKDGGELVFERAR